MDIIYSKCYNGVIMVGGFADDAFWVLSSCCPEMTCCVHVFTIHPTLIAASRLWKRLSRLKLKEHYTWYMYGIYHAYTWYMSCIYQVFLIWSFEGELRFLNISCGNIIRLSSITDDHATWMIMAWSLLWFTALNCP